MRMWCGSTSSRVPATSNPLLNGTRSVLGTASGVSGKRLRTAQHPKVGFVEVHMLKVLGLNVGVVILVCSVSSADTLVLRDGSTHTGRFVSATTGTVSFSEAGTVQRYARSK